MARILIVDDNEMDLLMAKTILENVGHEIFFATDGEDALGIFRANDIDVVVTDMIMPRVDGLSLIHEIRQIDANAQVVAVSGVSKDELALAEDVGAVETLSKPVDPETLVEVVGNAVKRSEAGS